MKEVPPLAVGQCHAATLVSVSLPSDPPCGHGTIAISIPYTFSTFGVKTR